MTTISAAIKYGKNLFTKITVLFTFCCMLLLASAASNSAQLNQVTSGRLDTVAAFDSVYIAPRRVQVWLPDRYSNKQKYSVVYMHDGQMLFDASTTWNKQEWGVDEVAGKLQNAGKTRPFIVVAIDNGGEALRYLEYLPQKPYAKLSLDNKHHLFAPYTSETVENINSIIVSDKYLQFLVTELKPYIDSTYSVHTDKANTFVMGSSMGGLISMYAVGEYPDVFGAAACVSTHWVGGSQSQSNAISEEFMKYLQNDFPAPGQHRIYFDYGDQTLDAFYPPFQAEVDKIMQAKGYGEENWLTVFDKGGDHSEKSWNKRLHQPLLFLLGK